MSTQEKAQNENTKIKPSHNLRKKVGYGKQAHFETIGVAWAREDGGFYVKLHGTQIIDSGFYAVPVKNITGEDERDA